VLQIVTLHSFSNFQWTNFTFVQVTDFLIGLGGAMEKITFESFPTKDQIQFNSFN